MSLVTSAIMFALFLVLGAIMLYRAEIDLNAAQLFGKVHSAAPNGSWCGDQRQLSAANGTLN